MCSGMRLASAVKKKHVKRLVALVIAFNFIQLGYFLLHRAPEHTTEHNQDFSPRRNSVVHPYVVKKWLQVPSFTPWVPSSQKPPLHSCEAFFGNGFTEVHQLVTNPGHKGGSFRCHLSDTLRASICEGTKMIMHASRISMAVGGEEIDEVLGRNEDDEMPVYRERAFEIQVPDSEVGKAIVSDSQLDVIMPRGQVARHTMKSLVESIRRVSFRNTTCSEVITRPTLFVTRFEYANLFHTVTDWYMSYVSSRVVGLEERPMVVLLDGHCKSPMDDGWEAFFTGVKYAKHFGDNVCFDHAVFVPLGYDTALFKSLGTGLPCYGDSPQNLESSKTSRLREFGEIFSASFLPPNHTLKQTAPAPARSRDIQVLFIRREDYLAHPRHSGKPETRLRNEEELYQVLVKWAREASRPQRRVSIFNGLFAHMNLGEQIQAVQTSSVLLGVHGAGLTHIVFARPGTSVLEILSPLFMRPHYQFISQWMGVDYQAIVMEESVVDCDQVLEKLNQIVRSLGTRQ